MNYFVFFAFILSLLCSVTIILMYRYVNIIFKCFKSRIDEIENYRHYE